MTTATRRPALKATGLRKSFGDKVVLDGIDLDIAEGTTFSLLGPNGAGKTTTVQILATLLSPDAGEVHVAGFDLRREPDAVRAAIGVTGQFSAVDNLLTGEENLVLMADLHHLGRRAGRRRAGELLDPRWHARLYFSDLNGLAAAANVFGGSSRDSDPLVLQVPTDDTTQSLMALLERIDHHALGVDRVTVHMPDLDDVFLALTGHSNHEKGASA